MAMHPLQKGTVPTPPLQDVTMSTPPQPTVAYRRAPLASFILRRGHGHASTDNHYPLSRTSSLLHHQQGLMTTPP